MNPFRYLKDGYRWLVNPYGFLDDALHRSCLTFRIHLPVLGRVLVTGEARLIAEIVKDKALDGGKTIAGLKAIFGSRSLIMLDGDAHAARRRILAPLFSGDALHAYDAPTIRAVREVLKDMPSSRPFPMFGVLQRIALKVIVAAMFGDDPGVNVEAETAVERFLNSFRNPLILFCRPLRIDAGPWSPWGRAVRNRRALCNLIRRELRAEGHCDSNTILARLRQTGLGEDDVVEEVLSLLLFGHDTAAATMAWAFAHIYSDVAIVERIRGEGSGAADRTHTPFLDACIHESMRLCPVVVHLARSASARTRIGEFPIEVGQKVIPCTYLAHRDPAVFPAPHVFRPERFLGGQRFDHSYFPFGFGSRTCVGKPFALRQMTLVVGEIIRSVDLELIPGYLPRPVRHLVLIVPDGGTLMRRR